MSVAISQTTQGLISGRLLDSRTGRAVSGAQVACSEESTGTTADGVSDNNGFYVLPLLPPGYYSIRVTAGGYQSQEAQELELAVAGRLEVNFLMRPLNDVWEAGLYRSIFLPGSQTIVTFYGPDVDPSHSGNFEGVRGQQGALESSVSEVVDPVEVDNLPLQGRDVYSLLFALPAVTSEGQAALGLGLSVNGQRPSSSNFLLDGVENNNYLITGPLTPIAPEAIQEYRVSISDYSAQYGRTNGYIANAVTRAGSDQYHGVAYFYFGNEALDANTFQRNLIGLGRPLDRAPRPGFQAGGPLLRKRLYISGAYERFIGRQRQDPQTYYLPTTALADALPNGSLAQQLLTQYTSPYQPASSSCSLSDGTGCFAPVSLQPPLSLDQTVGLVRLDYIPPGGAHHVLARVAYENVGRPNLAWSPYEQFSTAYDESDVAAMLGDQWAITPRVTNEVRASFSYDNTGFGAAGQVPTLQVPVNTALGEQLLTLPGSTTVYPYENNSHSVELLDNLVWTHGRHVMIFGGGVLLRRINGFDAVQANGIYTFNDLNNFANGTPSFLQAPINRADISNLSLPDFNTQYVDRQYDLFAQDSFRATSRLTLNYGLRYDHFGAPHSIGSNRTPILELGPGNTLLERLSSSTLNFSGGPAGLLYQPDNHDFGVRLGFSYGVVRSGRTLLRGGYGIFYDRPFDNLWETTRNNVADFAIIPFSGTPINYSQPLAYALPAFASQYTPYLTSVPNLTFFQPSLRNGYTQDIFLGIEQRVSENLTVDVNGMSALGRDLLTNDTLGFNNLFNGSQPGIPPGQLVTYRANQGISDYYALTIQARYHRGRSLLQGAYTWSHSIDNQSDPLGLDLSSFGFTSGLPAVPDQYTAGFATPQDSNGDRGNSDFDERHNLVLLGVYELPAVQSHHWLNVLSRDWTIAGVGALRSGFPYTVYSLGGLKGFARANILDPAQTRGSGQPAGPGEVELLNAAGFGPAGGPGEPAGRNAFIGPGFVNLDLSVNRAFTVRGLPESSRLILRADFFNALNHANLNNPYPVLADGFGLATYGRIVTPSGFPTPEPLAETPRQIQLSIRLRF